MQGQAQPNSYFIQHGMEPSMPDGNSKGPWQKADSESQKHHRKVTMSSSLHLSHWEESARQKTWGKCPSRMSTPTIIQTGFFWSGLLAAG